MYFFDSPLGCTLLSDTRMRCNAHVTRASRWTILFAAGLCLFFGPGTARPLWGLPHHDNHALHKEIEALEWQWRDAMVGNNVSVMDHLLADDYIGISANGTVETKAQELAQSKAGTLRIQSLDLSDLKVRVFGDTAVVTSKAQLTGINGQSDISGNYRYTRVYNKRLGQWKIVSFEASRIHDEDARTKK